MNDCERVVVGYDIDDDGVLGILVYCVLFVVGVVVGVDEECYHHWYPHQQQ